MLEHGADPRLATRCRQHGPDHGLDESPAGVLEDLQLQRLLGLEVRKETALGELEILRQPPDAQTLETDAAGQRRCVLEDGLARQLSFAHLEIIARSF